MGVLNKVFGTYSSRQIKKIMPVVDAIEKLADKYSAMSDEDMLKKTTELKERYQSGSSLEELLPDSFALVREACDRVLGKRPFKVQLMGGIILHQGRIAEMKTGEGKTIVATMPAYLNALTGRGVHIVTVNEYLAKVGAEEMGRVYAFLGMSTGLIYHGQTKEDKQKAYNCDITYGTNNEFGFDYLRDNMVIYKEQMVQRGHVFTIVDEVDSILIDEARTPLIISGEGDKPTDMYDKAESFVHGLKEFRIKELDDKEINDDVDADYIVDEKARTAVLTARGVERAEKFFGLENLSDAENTEINHNINQALRARGIMHRDVDYVIRDGQVIIVDTNTGRLMFGRRYSDGLHQAIEAKEHVQIEKENKTLATITFQNYFRMYEKLSGMTGTALTEDVEFREIYGLDVVEIPTNKPMIRVDHDDEVYKTTEAKYDAIIRQVKASHEKGQPVLIGTVSVAKSEELSGRLKKEGIVHTVLNAKHVEKEAEIVAMAGKYGTVTISTNMAGRGTDIMLGGNPEFMAKKEMQRLEYDDEMIGLAVGSSQNVSEEVMAARKVFKDLYNKYRKEIEPEYKEVCNAGGLFIIGTERHESRRIDNQLRGRSGRQGDPGESKFFLSLEDDLLRIFGSDRMINMVERLGLPDDQPIKAGILSNSIENAQKQIESQNFNRRKNVLSYDDVMNEQRKIVYKQRLDVLNGADLKESILSMMKNIISAEVNNAAPADEEPEWNLDSLNASFVGAMLGKGITDDPETIKDKTPEEVAEELYAVGEEIYNGKEDLFGEDRFREIERVVLLQNVDRNWIDHLDAMEDLKSSIGLQAYAHRDPVNEYRVESGDMFDEMNYTIQTETVRLLLSVIPKPMGEIKRQEVAKVTAEGGGDDGTVKKKPVVKKANEKVGRNDPCPCGSGKKYKNCCGRNA